MRRAVLPTVLAAAALAPAGAQGASRMCDNAYGGDVVSATNVSCVRARQVVRTWGERTKRTGRANRTVLRYRCRLSVDSVEGQQVCCTARGGRVIRFYVNLP